MSESLLGVIIGAIAAITGGLLGGLMEHRHNKKMMLLKEKKATYELVYEIIYDLTYNKANIKDNIEFDDRCKRTASKLSLYAPTNIQLLFINVLDVISGNDKSVTLNEFKYRCELLNKAIRKDLEI